jgi:hypothetical protein
MANSVIASFVADTASKTEIAERTIRQSIRRVEKIDEKVRSRRTYGGRHGTRTINKIWNTQSRSGILGSSQALLLLLVFFRARRLLTAARYAARKTLALRRSRTVLRRVLSGNATSGRVPIQHN